MPTLILKFKDKFIQKNQLNKGMSLTIGRGKNSDICIENLAVSGNHAKIDSVGNDFLLTDLKSKNGTLVNGNLITTHYLKNNDIITIGKHSLVFMTGINKSALDQDIIGDDKTVVINAETHKSMMTANVGVNKNSGKDDSNAALSFLSSGKDEINLSKKVLKIGKSPFCEIVMKGFWVGKVAATISNRPKGYFLSYIGGFKKPKINGKPVTGTVQLKEFDVIQIGSIKMQFINKS